MRNEVINLQQEARAEINHEASKWRLSYGIIRLKKEVFRSLGKTKIGLE